MLGFNNFIRDEEASGVVEMILIIVVLIGIVILFRTKLTSVVNTIFNTITTKVKTV